MAPLTRRVFLLGSAAIIGGVALRGMADGLAPPEGREVTSTKSRLHMGTFVTITVCHSERDRREAALAAAFEEIVRLENILAYQGAGALAILNAQGHLRDAPQELHVVMAASVLFHARTQGAFNPAVLPLLLALRSEKASTVAQLPRSIQAELRHLMDFSGVTATPSSGVSLPIPGMGLTLAGIAKGYIIDKTAQTLNESGIQDFLIAASGDIRAGGKSWRGGPWMVGIHSMQAAGTKLYEAIPLSNEAIATSSNAHSLAQLGYAHIIPACPEAASALSASVVAPTAMEADALATALMAMPRERQGEFLVNFPRRVWIQDARGMTG